MLGFFSLNHTFMALPGTASFPHTYYEDVFISEAGKKDIEYLKGNIDHWISSLVRDKKHIKTYRDYYTGIRDEKDFEYLTNNFGIGTPSTLKFTNLIKPRVDSLVDQIESDSHTFGVSCVDNKTIDLIQERKKSNKIKDIMGELDALSQLVNGATERGDKMPSFSELKNSLDGISRKHATNFLSDFEIAAQKVLTYFKIGRAHV